MSVKKSNPIKIVPYDHRWPAEFHRIGLPLREAMGDLAIRIDHIGSTAVPGLAAKDVIDVQATVAILDKEKVVAALAPLGYTLWEGITGDHVPPGQADLPEQWNKLFFRAPEGQRRTNLHIRQEGRANQRYALLFRDYLRVDPQAAGAYSQVKESLARLHPEDLDAYYDIKDPVCDIIISAAELWANATGYIPGPADL
ncbi:MAG TPA: GrpB family protein [Ktedonobacteraceae bacterium]|nr:GrpB family protein [Ktedonobacteraceae bacterium]